MTTRIAILDPGSFVLPYDHQLVQALAARGAQVEFFGSATRYNGELLDAMRTLPGVTVDAPRISRTVASRGRGALAYAAMLVRLLWRSPRFDIVNLQFSGWWPAEWLVFSLLRRRFVFTVHNAVPHGFAGAQHAPTRRLARLATALLFVSASTRDDFIDRYGERFRVKSHVLPHGLMPAAPGIEPVAYAGGAVPRALVFWGRVQPYKGVELFADLARSPQLRARGMALKVVGAWSAELMPVKAELASLGVQVDDRYLDTPALLALLAEEAIFLLPYQRASQSGALYTLLHHGRVFICADTGDLGDFMRRHGLEGLLLKERSVSAVLDCVAYFELHRDAVLQAFQRAQDAHRWGRLIAEAGTPYGLK